MMRLMNPAWLAMLVASSVLAADYPAILDWSRRVDLSVPVSGVVQSVHVQPGQRVKPGEPLLSLDQTPFLAGVAEARADADRYAEEAADAKRELERAEELYARTVSSTSELDASKLRHARALALSAAAHARLERARWQLAATELRAPFPAIVLDRKVEPGAVVAAQCQPPLLINLAHAEELVARAALAEDQVAAISIGGTASFRTGGRGYAGKISALRVREDGNTVVEVTLPRAPGLAVGHQGVIRLP